MQIIIKQSYNHYNRTLGMQIKNKDHYDRVCKEQGMVSYEKAEEIASNARREKIKKYKVSKQSLAIIDSAKNSKDKNGNIKLSDRAIKALIDKKAIGRKIPDYMKLPTAYTKGGFSS